MGVLMSPAVSTGEAEPEEVTEGGEKKKLTDAEKKELRQQLKDEVLQIAGQIREMPQFKLLVIDTENKFVSTGVAKCRNCVVILHPEGKRGCHEASHQRRSR